MTPRQVTSIRGIRYRLGRELGRGGQGTVFAVEGERLAVKLLRGRPRAGERLRDQLAMVARLPLDGLAVARPVDQLRPPHVGYVMELFTGMVPLRALLQPPKAGVTQWYLDGGGLGRRLRLLAHVAQAISALHGRGLVYTDLSPHNVFVSANMAHHEVRLIDIDNLHAATTPGRLVYTPRYGAPEVVRQTGLPTTLADAHAFAVLAFETLALVHPLLGDEVRDGEPELEEKALRGELPWVDSSEDDRNQSSDGIPREMVVSPVLQQDFQRAFGSGLSSPAERPGLTTWTEHLHNAADRTIVCRSCSGSYYVPRRTCPWCDAGRPDCVVARVTLWDPQRCQRTGGDVGRRAGIVATVEGKERVLDQMVVSEGRPIHLTERVTHGASGNKPTLRLEFVQGRVTVAPLVQGRLSLVSSERKSGRPLTEQVDLPVGAGHVSWRIHFGNRDQLHRVIRLDLHKGTA